MGSVGLGGPPALVHSPVLLWGLGGSQGLFNWPSCFSPLPPLGSLGVEGACFGTFLASKLDKASGATAFCWAESPDRKMGCSYVPDSGFQGLMVEAARCEPAHVPPTHVVLLAGVCPQMSPGSFLTQQWQPRPQSPFLKRLQTPVPDPALWMPPPRAPFQLPVAPRQGWHSVQSHCLTCFCFSGLNLIPEGTGLGSFWHKP